MNCRRSIGYSLGNLAALRAFVRTSLINQGLSEDVLNTIVLAVDEVCANLIIHARHDKSKDELEIRILRPNKKMFVFEIIDGGQAFDVNMFRSSDLGALVREGRKGGLGIRLVKSVMDKIEYDVQKNKNICRLIKIV